MNWIKGHRVVEIISDQEILIDYGYEHGAAKGDLVVVYSAGEPIYDPETKKQIGTFDIIKEELSVSHVIPDFSVCTKTSNVPSFYASITALSNPLSVIRKSTETLDVNQKQISNREWKKGGTISLNDSVMVGKMR